MYWKVQNLFTLMQPFSTASVFESLNEIVAFLFAKFNNPGIVLRFCDLTPHANLHHFLICALSFSV
jgi:hypothetical protein